MSRTVSRAAAKRLAKAKVEQAAQTPTLPDPLAEFLDRYVPTKIDAEVWAAVRSDHRAVMVRSGLTGLESFKKRSSEAALYLAARYELGLATTRDAAFTFEAIDDYYRLLPCSEQVSTRNDRRSRLRKLAEAANPGIGAPRQAPTLGHKVVKTPYSQVEEASIRRVARNQRRSSARRRMCAVVGLSGGAGLDSSDYRDLTRCCVIDHGDDGIEVRVPGRRARIVWVRNDYEALVRIGIEGLRPSQLVIGEKRDRRNIVPSALKDAEIHGNVPHVEASRLRNTWLAWLMTQPVPLKVILDAAGISSSRTLIELLPHVPASDSATSVMRGEAVR